MSGYPSRLRRFASDERGVMTFWLLMWSIVFLGFAGLAVDVANAYRTRSMLQATADAAAHAGVIELVKPLTSGSGTTVAGDGNVQAAAVQYATKNMAVTSHGNVLVANDVEIGHWDKEARKFTVPATALKPANAVRAVARRESRATGNTNDNNPVPTSLLRIVDLESWDVVAQSIASYDADKCSGKVNRIVAMKTVEFTAGWNFGGDLCIHGEQGIGGTQGNAIVPGLEGVVFTMYDTGWAKNKSDISTEHGWYVPGCDGCEDRRHPETAEKFIELAAVGQHIEMVKTDVLNSLFLGSANAVAITGHGNGQANREADFMTAVLAGKKKFHLTCENASGVFTLKNPVVDGVVTPLTGVTIYTGPGGSDPSGHPCRLQGSNMILNAVTIATTNTYNGGGSNASIRLNGQPSAAPGSSCLDFAGGLRIFSLGGIDVTAGAAFPSMQFLVMGDVTFTSQLSVANRLEVVAGGEFTLTAGTGVVGAGYLTPICGFQASDSAVPVYQTLHIVY